MSKHKAIYVIAIAVVLIVSVPLGVGVLVASIAGVGNNNASAATCTPNASVALAPSTVSLNSGATVGGQPLTTDQLSNASTIVGVATSRGSVLHERDALLALMVAYQESRLRNLPYGDRDSVGLFQQRPSQGWGTREQILNPVYAANKFYDALIAVPNRDSLTLLDEAIAVQRPSRAAYLSPSNYFPGWEALARSLLGSGFQPTDPSITPQLVAFDTSCPVGGAANSVLEVAVQAALGEIGLPYVWGGESPTGGFDCSGLMQFAFAKAGIQIPRVAADQATVGTPINDPSQLQRGDLVFWKLDSNTPNVISHVAMYLGNNQIIVAPHTGALVQIAPMFWGGYVGATRIVQPSATVLSNTLTYQLPIDSGSYTLGSVVGGNVYIMGDSITERAQAQYRAAFQAAGMTVTIDASASRSLNGAGIDGNRLSGLQALDHDKKAGLIQGASVIVIAVGSNGVETPQSIDAAISTVRLGPNANTTGSIWLVDTITVGRHDTYNQSVIQPSNQAIYGEAKSQGYHIIPWFNTVDPTGKPTQPSNLEQDPNRYIDNSDGLGIHPTPAGIGALVNLVVSSVGTSSNTQAVDFIAPAKTPIKAIGTGSVTSVRTDPVLGIVVIIDYQGGVQTQYAHLGNTVPGLQPGVVVTAGTPVGSVGASGAGAGNRLSFSVAVNGQLTDPIQFLRQAGLRP